MALCAKAVHFDQESLESLPKQSSQCDVIRLIQGALCHLKMIEGQLQAGHALTMFGERVLTH